jgi:L-serine/L-threonine ammonia-lyase
VKIEKGQAIPMSNPLHIRTPLLESLALSNRSGRRIFLKMENLQPTGSFKIRGIGLLCQTGQTDGIAHFVSSSGGNAGYAAAYAGRMLHVPTTVFVPTTTSLELREKIAFQGAQVEVVGDVWDETHQAALNYSQGMEALYVPPFDHPRIWEGNSSLVDEIIDEMGSPDAIILSVGGGGLLCGVIEGLRRHKLNTPIIAVETQGTASLAASLEQGKLVTLDRITGVATTLGAKTVALKAFEWSQQHPVRSVVVTDDAAIRACLDFADEHKCIVEPACGASLSMAYGNHPVLGNTNRVAIIVCGGIGTNLKMLQTWQSKM